MKRSKKLTHPDSQALEWALRWPAIFGLEAREVFLSDGVGGGVLVSENQGLRIAYDRRWLSDRDVPEKLARLGHWMALWALGIGPWFSLRGPDRRTALLATIDHFAPLWVRTVPQNVKSKGMNLPKYLKWLRKHGKGAEPFAVETAARTSAEGIANQVRSLEMGLDRIGVAPIDDVGAALAPAQLHRRPSLEGNPVWIFLFQRDFVEARRRLRLEKS